MLPTLVLLGPTASGKTATAVAIARRLASVGAGSEVVNADSMLVYRGMDIGTAKPTVAERGGIVHHLIDTCKITDTATVADFQRLAREAIKDCHARQIVPIVVGGSALYVRAIVDRFEFPGTDSQVRGRLEAELKSRGAAALYADLVVKAPQAAEHLDSGNGRRIVRALEILELTGDWQPRLPAAEYAWANIHQIGLFVDRIQLDARIAERVDRMWAAGLVTEVRRLAEAGLAAGRTASRALGYRQVLAYLAGELSEQEAHAQTIVRTRQFARKQLSWFRRDPRICWFSAHQQDAVVDAAVRIVCEGDGQTRPSAPIADQC